MATADPPRPLHVGGDYIAGDQHVTQNVAGDIIGRDQINNYINNIIQRALSAAEEAEQARAFEQQRLAQGASALLQRLQARSGAAPAGANPYKGLLEYRLADAEIFFGRQAAVSALQAQLARGPLTVLQSESGAGKTSLLQAGLAPRLLAAGHLPLYLRPYNVEPGYALKRAFLADLSRAPELATAPLREFLRQVGAVLGPAATLYICLDQFEEFFTQLEPAAQDEFARELADCVRDPSLNVAWLLALRSEYFGRLHRFQPVGLRPFENAYTLLPLTRAEAREVAEAPAASQGVTFEAGLVDRLLDDLGQTIIAPPQLQLVCAALFAERPPGAATITHALYVDEGGVAGILRGHLDRVLSRDLPREHRAAARRLLEALISSEQQRVIRTQAELVDELAARGLPPAALDVVLSQLVDSRLVKTDETEAGPAYELAHDYLLDEIKLDPDVQARKAAQELLEQELRAYRRHQTLLTAERLKVIEPYQAELRLTAEARDLLAASQAAIAAEQQAEAARRQKELEDAQALARATEAQRQAEAARAREAEQSAARLRRGNRALLAVGVLALLAAVVAVVAAIGSGQNAERASDNARTAEAANTESAANLGTAQAASTRAVAEATRSAAAEVTAEAERLLAERQARLAQARELAAQSGEVLAVEPELGTLLALEAVRATLPGDGRVAEAEIALYRAMAVSPFRGTLATDLFDIRDAVFNAAGDRLAVADTISTELWTTTNERIASLWGRQPRFSPDGAQVLTIDCTVTSQPCPEAALSLWSATDGAALGKFGVGVPDLVQAEFSPDGRHVATVGCANDPCIQQRAELWTTSGSQVAAFGPEMEGAAQRILFNPAGGQLATSTGEAVTLWDLAGVEQATLTGTQPVYSPDGTMIATTDFSGDIWLWTSDGTLRATLTGTDAAFSPDSRYVATLLNWTNVIVWDAATGAEQARFPALVSGTGHLADRLQFSPDGQRLAVLTPYFDSELWGIDGSLIARLPGHGNVTSLNFQPGGERLVTTGCDDLSASSACVGGTALVWDLAGNRLARLDTAAGGVRNSWFSPDGSRLLTLACDVPESAEIGCYDIALSLWDVDTVLVRHLERSRREGGLYYHQAQFGPEGGPAAGLLFTAACDDPGAAGPCPHGALRAWEPATGELVDTLQAGPTEIRGFALDRTGARLLVSNFDGSANLLDVASGRRLEHFPSPVELGPSWWLSPAGDRVLQVQPDLSSARLLALPGQRRLGDLAGYDPVFSPAGDLIALAGVDEAGQSVTNVFSDQGDWLAFLPGVHARFSPDGQRILTAACEEPEPFGSDASQPCNAGSGVLSTAATGERLATLGPFTTDVLWGEFSPDGQRIVTVLADNTLALWDGTGGLISTLAGHSSTVLAARFSPDGARLLTGGADNTARLWDAQTGRPIATLSGHAQAVTIVAFSPNSHLLLTAGADGSARLWDRGGNAIVTLPGVAISSDDVPVDSASFSPDGTRLAATSARGIWLWELYPDLAALLAAAEVRVTRPLSADECLQYLHTPCS